MKELNEYRGFMQREELHKALNTLVGILEGVAADGNVTEAESEEVKNWYDLHRSLLDVHPFNQIFPLIETAFADGHIDIEEAQDVLWLCRKFTDEDAYGLYFNLVTSKIQKLEGMLQGMLSDGAISDSELKQLNDWLNENDDLSGTYPFDEIYSLLLCAKEDGVISDDERNMLKAFFANFVDTRESYNIHEDEVKKLQEEYCVNGICAICPEITFENKNFCFTGESKRAERYEIAALVEKKGAHFFNGVSRKIDYLVVGGNGNPCWAFSCYGRKVEQAMQLRKQGYKIIIVHENDFWDEV
ncbi:MAG: NAD-dependent DNA ligase [Ruminococcaceae bacterium]|nr:NAD-dependent DNA ligase [Oscillospiraceae bacterium]